MNSNARYIPAHELMRVMPNAGCCDCSCEPANTSEEAIWTIWRNGHIYCPKCAKRERISPE